MMNFLKFKDQMKKEEKAKKMNKPENNKKKDDKSSKETPKFMEPEFIEEKKEEIFQIENYANIIHHLNGPIYLSTEDKIDDFIDDPRFLKSVIFLENSSSITKEDLLKIFEDYSLDIHVNTTTPKKIILRSLNYFRFYFWIIKTSLFLRFYIPMGK